MMNTYNDLSKKQCRNVQHKIEMFETKEKVKN